MKEATSGKGLKLINLGRKLLSLRPPFKNENYGYDHFTKEFDSLAQSLNNIDGQIYLGLLGGTGVGKSTLISALAQNPISAASALRPTTHVPIIYRHQDFKNSLKGEECIHQAEQLRFVAIIDFPDFDSLVSSHVKTAHNLLKEMDMVIWLTDHQKYADRKLYEMIGEARHLSTISQVALLNKIDEFADRPDGEQIVGEITNAFYGLLKDKAKWQGPPPLAISAYNAFLGRNSGGLGPLRDILKELREEKARRAIENENLKARLRQLMASLNAGLEPQLWLGEIERLKKLKENFGPEKILKTEMDALKSSIDLIVQKELSGIKLKSRGLLSFCTDFWEFFTKPFKKEKKEIVPLSCPALAHYLAGQLENLGSHNLRPAKSAAELTAESALVISESFAEAKLPGAPNGVLLYVWPLIWAVLLLWAETAGPFNFNSIVQAAIRSVVPWLLGSALGLLVFSRFLWYRLKKKLQGRSLKALELAEENLKIMAGKHFQEPLDAAISQKVAWLDGLADFNNMENDFA